jgi:anti-sigma factor RsiW
MIAERETHLVTPEEILAYLDGELARERAESVAAHLDGCLLCQKMSGVLRDASQTLAAWTVEPAAADASFERRLSEMAAKHSAASFGLWRWIASSKQHRFLAVTACAAVVFGLFVGLSPSRKTSGLTVTAGPAASQERKDPLDAAKAQYEGLLERRQAEQLSSNLVNSETEESPSPKPAQASESQPMIARTVTLSIVAKDFGFSRTSLDAIVSRHHGYTATLTANTQQNTARSLQASLRVPAAELNATVAELKLLGQVENETQAGEEVTQAHADLVARLKNSRETEQRLQAILLQRTGKMSDVLEVEQEIARVRGAIEQMEGEQKNLEHRVNFATIDLNLTEEYKALLGSPSISTRFHNALVAGFRAAEDSAFGVVLFAAEDGPVTLLWLAFLAPVAWLVRRRWLRSASMLSSF